MLPLSIVERQNPMRVTLWILLLSIIGLAAPGGLQAQANESYIWEYNAPVNITGAEDLVSRLESEVSKVISTGHLAPFRALYGEGNTQYYWYEPYASVYTLALAYPYVNPGLQAAIIPYLQGEMNRYPLWDTRLLDPSQGAKRQPDHLSPAEFGTLPNGYAQHPKLFALYALWLYAQNTGDWGYIESNWGQITSFYGNHRGEIGQYYGSIAGAIGMARLAYQKPTRDDATVNQAVSDIQNGLNQGTNLDQFGANAENNYRSGLNHNWDWRSRSLYMGFHFLNLTPEIGRYMAENEQLASQIMGNSRYSAATGLRRFPVWYMAQSPGWSRYYDEGSGMPVDVKSMLFPLRAWVYGDSAQQLRLYVDAPDALVGDYYYMQGLAYTIAAHGTTCWENIRTTEPECDAIAPPAPPQGQPTVTPTPDITPTLTPTMPPTPEITPTAAPTIEPDGAAALIDATDTGSTVDVSFLLVNAVDLYGLETECVVDPALLNGETIVPGTGFNRDNSFFVGEGAYDAATGQWLVGASRLQPNPAIEGDTLAYALQYTKLAEISELRLRCRVLGVDINGREVALEVVHAPHLLPLDQTDPTPTDNMTEMPPVEPTMEPSVAPTVAPPADATVQPTQAPNYHTVSGTVTYQGRSDHSGIEVALLNEDGTMVANTITDAGGSYRLENMPEGEYLLVARAPYHLSFAETVLLGASSPVGPSELLLRVGDTDNNQIIDLADATFIGANYHLEGDLAPPNADLNLDRIVNISDLVLVGYNFGLTASN